jgi:hypothetical protein
MPGPSGPITRFRVVFRRAATVSVAGGVAKFCPHCGAFGAPRLGSCSVCRLSVCEKCGNVQHIKGERTVIHNECLRESGDSFSMIKFVK